MDIIAVGSDHAGFALKEEMKDFLVKMGCQVADMGANDTSAVDYPDYGCLVAERVAAGEFKKGILFCGSGVGMSIVANKFPGVRAVLSLDEETARMSRLHNNTNILVMAGRRTNQETACKIIETWLFTPFEGGRHQARIDKISEIEKKLCTKA